MLRKNVLQIIFAYLDYGTLRTICTVCKVWKEVGSDPIMWASFNQWNDLPSNEKRLLIVLQQVMTSFFFFFVLCKFIYLFCSLSFQYFHI